VAPGLASATRGGRRPGPARRLFDVGPVIVLGALAIGAVFVLEGLLGAGGWIWPLAIAIVGVGLLWRQADEAQRERWVDATGRIDPVRIVVGDGGWASYARLAAGLGLVVVAIVLFSLRGGSLALARDVTLAVLLGLGGLAIVVGPWIYRLANELSDEREERVRTQERADVAAHLHDSVLQTLALIQKNPSDAARLARAQERSLRAWLFSTESVDERTVASALRAMAGEIEDSYGLNVDVVAVGDCDLDEAVRPIVAAAREATTNAAKHAGVPRIDVYAEITEGAVDVFVRDRGTGFDPDATPEDRLGVRRSIIDRMHRHGGTAEVRSAPGEGTEVRLHLGRGHQEEGR
jgi:signal transduction histidine kinase